MQSLNKCRRLNKAYGSDFESFGLSLVKSLPEFFPTLFKDIEYVRNILKIIACNLQAHQIYSRDFVFIII